MNLWQKLVKIRKDIDVFVKNGKSYGYEYVTGSQILHKIKKNMDELQVLLTPKIGEHTSEKFHYKNKKGKDVTDFVIEAEGFYEWINAENPEERELIPWKFFGQQDDISKSFGSALTYSERYFLLKFFGVPTDEDDVDGRDMSGRQRSASSNPRQSNRQNGAGSQRSNVPQQEQQRQTQVANEQRIQAIHAQIRELSEEYDMPFEETKATVKQSLGIQTFKGITVQQASNVQRTITSWLNDAKANQQKAQRVGG